MTGAPALERKIAAIEGKGKRKRTNDGDTTKKRGRPKGSQNMTKRMGRGSEDTESVTAERPALDLLEQASTNKKASTDTTKRPSNQLLTPSFTQERRMSNDYPENAVKEQSQSMVIPRATARGGDNITKDASTVPRWMNGNSSETPMIIE